MPVSPRRGRDARRHLGKIRVRLAVAIMVQIMELADPREAGLEHFDIELRGHRLDILRLHAEREAVHDLAPGPEAVG